MGLPAVLSISSEMNRKNTISAKGFDAWVSLHHKLKAELKRREQAECRVTGELTGESTWARLGLDGIETVDH
jgi:hypothetical protein